ncbi:MAG TPA: elongation factor G [Bacteroidales bacterium]|nr:elongation factor G [Bacteroidales bacterium]HPE55352.1 elongation factor G [Bacteroidales bacterium]HRX95958.1 elongation factor G [Bacteroidales bacterium]
MKVYQTKDIRNIALVGGAKSGKTTLAEAMLFEGGRINRRGTIDDKNTVSDYRPIELERENSVFSTVLYTEFNNRKINIIDTPGFDDFVGEVIAALKVADTAVSVVNAQNGVEVGTEIAWRNTSKYNTPVIFAINHLEHENSNFDETLRQMKTQFGAGLTVFQYPVNAGVGFNSVIDLLKMKMFKFPENGGPAEIIDIPDGEKENAEEMHGALIEDLATTDESLMEKFFDAGTLTEDEMRGAVKEGLKSRTLFPILCIGSKHSMGVNRLMEFIGNNAPSPAEMPPVKTIKGKDLTCDASQPASAFVFKTSIEPHFGEVSFFKLYNGEIAEGTDLINSKSGSKERLGQLFAVYGKNREKIEKVVAGDIVASVKLKDAPTNSTLTTAKNTDDIVEPIEFPEPKFRVAVKAVNQGDDEKLGTILSALHKVDQTLMVEYSKELKQVILGGQGELHLNITKWQIEKQDHVQIEFVAPKIPYRETITKAAKATYRHKKQSGGAGQFGEVHMMIEPYHEGMAWTTEFPVRGTDEHPLAWGGKLVMNNCIVGGAIDARFMPAILKGVMEKMEEGPLTGSYARDIVVYIYDGKMHPVDSNEISFKLAGRNAFREAFKNAGPQILEPIYDVEVLVPEDRMGDVMTDLQGRRAIIMGMGREGNYQKISAKAPLAEMNKYATALSSITSGRAMYSMKFAEYSNVPPDVQMQLLKTYEESQQEEE